jgi:hypothetical protein
MAGCTTEPPRPAVGAPTQHKVPKRLVKAHTMPLQAYPAQTDLHLAGQATQLEKRSARIVPFVCYTNGHSTWLPKETPMGKSVAPLRLVRHPERETPQSAHLNSLISRMDICDPG